MISKYTKLRKLGSGGEVWMAERLHDKRTFAIKYLKDNDPDSVARFQREVRCLSQLDHPNIIRVTSKSLVSPPYWYAMPPYDHSLYSELQAITGQQARIYTVFRSMLEAIRYAHNEGVIHRDLKPENILMNSDSDLAVSDFGLGRIVDTKSTRMTVTGIRLGTVLYCAPEQMRDFKSADHRADIFSLGRMLYELYSGELTSAIQDLSLVPGSIASIVERATATNPDHRYQQIEKMLEEFDSTMEVMLGIVETSSLDEIIEKLRASSSWSDEEITQLVVSLENARDEDEVIHAALMKIPAPLFGEIAIRSRALARTLMRGFSRHAQSQGWPFSYTDSIADVSKELFNVLSDSEMCANLFQTVLIVGAGHSRWHVMRIAAQLLQSVRDPSDISAFAKVLKDHPGETECINRYVTRSKVPASLRHFIPTPEPE